MHIAYHCPSCGRPLRSTITDRESALVCTDCNWNKPLPADPGRTGPPQRCLVCGCNDLWRQKDFPQKLGLALVALGALLSTIAWAYHLPATSLGVLLGFALVDLVLYMVMPDVLVCYRCAARHRSADLADDHPRFNLETAERYRQEGARLAKSRPAGPSGP